jgi:thioredoxin-like negative regulator of GroEL
MAIAPVSTTSSSIPPPIDPMRQAFGQLTSAIQSGDLSAAQSAYTALTQAQPNQGSGPFSQALSQIGDALQSGDIGKAQQAMAALQQQMQAMKGAHHHHGHHHAGGGGDKSQSASASPSTSSDPTASTTSTNLVDVSA